MGVRTIPGYYVKNVSGRTLEAQGIVMEPGDTRYFETACELVRFINEGGRDLGILESAPGRVINRINRAARAEGCPERVRGIVVRPTRAGTPTEGSPRVVATDSGDQQGAPRTEEPPGARVETDNSGSFGDPGDIRTPAEALHDPQNQAGEGEVRDGLESRGMSGEEAQNELERGLRGDPPPGEERADHTGETSQSDAQNGDPVHLMSGRLQLRSVDLDVPTPFIPIRFVRSYLSGFPYYGPLGYNWDHNWNVYLRPLNNGDIARWNGHLHEDVFRLGEDGSWEPPRGVFEKLQRVSDLDERYEILTKGGGRLLFARPPGWTDTERIPLVGVEDNHGNKIALQYDSLNRLVKVEDDDGRGLAFFYNDCNLLDAVQDHAGRRVSFGYDEYEHLVCVCEPATEDYPDGIRTYYEYDSGSPLRVMRHNLIRKIDHDQNVVLVNKYCDDPGDPQFNRVIEQWIGDVCYQFQYEQIQWVPDSPEFVDIAAMRTTVLHPDGSVRTYTFNYRGDLLDERFRLNRDGSYRVAIYQRRFDEQGNLTELVRPDGSSTLWVWDDKNPDPRNRGNLLRVELRASPFHPVPSRIIQRIDYDPNLQLPVRIRYENGSEVRLRYDAKGNPQRIEWPDATLPDGTVQKAVTLIETNARGQVTAMVSPEGVRREYRYEPAGSPKAGMLREVVEDAGGENRTTAYDYDAFGYLSQEKLPGGSVRTYRYDARGNLRECVLPAVGGKTDAVRYHYDAAGRVRRVERPRGEYSDGVIAGDWIEDVYDIDAAGRLHRIVIGNNTARPRVWKIEPDHEGRPVRITDPEGTVTERCWDERGLLLRETSAAGTSHAATTRWIYDTVGRVTRVYEPGSDPHVLEYDPFGRVAEAVLPNGSRIVNEWGPFDLPTAQRLEGDPGDGGPARLLRSSRYQYDERGRLTHYTEFVFDDHPEAAVEQTMVKWYDADGRCVRKVSPSGHKWKYRYNGLGQLVAATDPLGNTREISYGPDGHPALIKETEAGPAGTSSRETLFEHDERGRLVRIRHASGATLSREYDARDLPVREVDAGGVVRQRTYGLLGELLETVIDPGGLALRYRHESDLLGRQVSFTDPAGATTSVRRDPLGRITETILSDGSVFRRSYNAAGLLAREESPDGSAVEYEYDAARRLIGFTATAGSGRLPVAPHRFAYDGANRIVRAESSGTVAIRRYDSLDRLTLDSFNGRAFKAEYDDRAMRMTLEFPDGRKEQHAWDALGRVTGIHLLSAGALPVDIGASSAGLLHEVRFIGAHRVAEERFASGASGLWLHDGEGRLMRVDHLDPSGQAWVSARYRHDLLNRRRVSQIVGLHDSNLYYVYDSRGRLVEERSEFALAPLSDHPSQAEQNAAISAAESAAAGANRIQTWELTDADVRKTATVTEGGTTLVSVYTEGPAHRIVAVDGQPYQYDAGGVRIADPYRLYVYDALGRIARISRPSDGTVLMEFAYDPFGRLAQLKTAGGTANRYHFSDRFLHEEDGSGSTVRQFAHHPGLLVPSVATTAHGTFGLHYDALHRLVLATDRGGQPAETYRYGTFGIPEVRDPAGGQRPGSAIGVHPVFNAMPYLPEAELYHTIHRLYDPQTGLFLARDPLLHAHSPNPYVYAAHDPVNALDPDGDLPPLIVAGLIVGAIGAVIGAGSVMLSGDDYDVWDVVAGAAIGFGAGFIGAVTFGAVSSAVGAGLLSAAGGSAAVASSSWAGFGISVASGAAGGAVSGLASGVFSGFAGGIYHGGIRGRGDMWEMALEGAYREGISGMAAGAVGGAFFAGSLRLGTIPRGMWASVRRSAAGGQPIRLLGRGLMSPYGLGSAAAGFASGMTGGVTRELLEGRDFTDAVADSWSDGVMGAGAGVVTTALHPTTYQYWRVRFNPQIAQSVQATRPGGVHHQRNVAQYPEFAVRRHSQNHPHDWIDRLNNAVTRGNIQGPQSEYHRPGNPLTHRQMHEQWRFGQPGNWTNIPTHGPWTPPWNPNYYWPNSLPVNQPEKQN